MRRFKTFAIILAINFAVLFGVAAILVAFCHPDAPDALHSVTDPFTRMDVSAIPAIERYRARDGAELSYRTYSGTGGRVVVLVHGSAGSSRDMHLMARAFEKDRGATVLVPDLRGHGANFPHGDLAYVGQLDDDMADFVDALKPRYAGKKWILLGFSSGGGFVLRIAGSAQGQAFGQFVLLSPFLRYDAPTVRPASAQDGSNESNGWYSVSVARIVGLSIFNFFGIHRFDGLPVLSFPVPSNLEAVTSSYSWRMQRNFAPHNDYRGDIANVSKRMEVFVGSKDELFLPNEFANVFTAQRKDIPVVILPGMGHSDMITKPEAIQAVVHAVTQTP